MDFLKQYLKYFFTFFLFYTVASLSAQNCTISMDAEQPVCKYEVFELSVPDCETCDFEWKKDGEVVGGNTNKILTSVTEQSVFTVKVTDNSTGLDCNSEGYLVMSHPDIFIDIEQLQLTCTNGDNDNGNTAKLRARASGEYQADEYHYFWDVKPIQVAPGDSSVALGLKAHQNYTITVKDNHSCFEKDTMWTEAYKNPEVEIFADPDTAFVQKPDINFSFVNNTADSIDISNYFWDFGDEDDTISSNLPNPSHRYTLNDQEIEDGGKQYFTTLTVINNEGCDTIFSHIVFVKPILLNIPNVFTPDGDGVNELFVITEKTNTQPSGGEGLKQKDLDGNYIINHYYERSKLIVFNRHGRIIFKDENYQNTWDGDNAPAGVYYYVLKATGPKGTDVYKGSVSIIR